MRIIDLFSGCGGLSLGFFKEGHEVVKAVEFDKNIAVTYKKNHPQVEMIIDDIANVSESNIFNEGDADIIIGGPPCQGFSMAGARIRNNFTEDPRNYLFKHYFNVVKKVKPKIFIMENVKGITTMQNGEIFEEIIKTFSDEKLLDGKPYKIFCKVVKSVEFGIPQKRERMLIIGTTLDNADIELIWKKTKSEIQDEYPSFFEPVTILDAIRDLPNVTKDGFIRKTEPCNEYLKYLSSSNDYIANHTKTNHSALAIDRMSRINKGENFTSLEEKINTVHSGSYGRLDWLEQAPTITTRFDTPAGGRFIHPEENRTLSPREAARIQSFPDDFTFYGTRTSICKQIGNAVPPKISFFLAKLVDTIIKEANK